MEHTTKRPLVLSTPPHVFDGITTQKVMLNVVIALVPTLIRLVRDIPAGGRCWLPP